MDTIGARCGCAACDTEDPPRWVLDALDGERINIGRDATTELLGWSLIGHREFDDEIGTVVYRVMQPAWVADEGRLEMPPIDRIRWVTFALRDGQRRTSMGGTT